jgi:hypothetical protein
MNSHAPAPPPPPELGEIFTVEKFRTIEAGNLIEDEG